MANIWATRPSFPEPLAKHLPSLAAPAMRPRDKSKTPRRFRPNHALLGVFLLSCLLYAGLIATWTLQSSNVLQGSPSPQQRGRHSLQAMAPEDNTQSTRSNTLAEVPNNSKHEGSAKLDQGKHQELTPTTNQESHGVADLPSNSSNVRQLRCLGWRATAGCSPTGVRLPQNDQDCGTVIPDGTSGYCEVEDMKSHERFMVMKRTCDRGHKGTVIRCSYAPGFANFRAKAQVVIDKALAPGYKLPNTNNIDHSVSKGIVMVVYPKLVASAYATVRTLREVHGCRLPIEIWLRPDEMNKEPGALKPLKQLARNTSNGEITFEVIHHSQALFFYSKVFAIYNSKFDQVLFLDADNVPVRDPTYLFTTPEFVDTGALFWPDYWHPQQTIFGINQTSLVWQLLDTPFVDMFEQESGQLLVDRKRHAVPLSLVIFYAFHHPSYFNQLLLAWGDKDLFRFAWLKLGVGFHMIRTLPAVVGELVGSSYCGMTMGQHDPNGDVIFLHRNQLKLTGASKINTFSSRWKKVLANAGSNSIFRILDEEYPDPAIWKHLIFFREGLPRSDYTIQKHSVMNRFTGLQRCFGGSDLHQNPHFDMRDFADLPFSGLETHLRHFAMEAARLQ